MPVPQSLVPEGMAHVVRKQVLLPACQDRRGRLERMNQRRLRGAELALKYLTILDTSALDVILLSDAHVLPHARKDFSSVVFFRRSQQAASIVPQFLRNAQDAGGFFVETVLAPDTPPAAPPHDADQNTLDQYQREVRAVERKVAFGLSFPFDVVNLDLTGPTEAATAPLEIVAALGQVFSWQSNPTSGEASAINEFTLAVTLPAWRAEHASAQLAPLFSDAIGANLAAHEELNAMLDGQLDGRSLMDSIGQAWPEVFRLGLPKLVIGLLTKAGWSIDPETAPQYVRREPVDGAPETITMLLGAVREGSGVFTGEHATIGYLRALHDLFGSEYSIVLATDVTEPIVQELHRLGRQRATLMSDTF